MVAALAACTSDTLVGSSPAEQTLAEAIGGTWAYAATLSGGGFDCRIQGVLLEIAVEGETLTGTAVPGIIFCVGGQSLAFQFALPAQRTPLVNGIVRLGRITFDIGDPSFHHTGELTPTTMLGEVSLDYDVPLEEPDLGVLPLRGTWAASRQPPDGNQGQ